MIFFCNFSFLKTIKLNSLNKLGKDITAVLLLLSVLLPTVFQFVSIFDQHEHIVCSEQQVHVHKTIAECEICLFHFTPLDYNFQQYKDLQVLLIPETTQDSFASFLFHSFPVTNIQLRGPPELT